ncbi:MAG: CheR family methyltransferase [Rhodospirillaceae bacterium]
MTETSESLEVIDGELVRFEQNPQDAAILGNIFRSMVKHKVFNLLHGLSGLGRFDVVFCRNVLIYFDQPTKKLVLENIVKLMPQDGFLLLGGAETVLGITEAFTPVPGLRAIYKVDGSRRRPRSS